MGKARPRETKIGKCVYKASGNLSFPNMYTLRPKTKRRKLTIGAPTMTFGYSTKHMDVKWSSQEMIIHLTTKPKYKVERDTENPLTVKCP